MVVPKKTRADGKVRFQVCHDFCKLTAAIEKEYLPLPFTENRKEAFDDRLLEGHEILEREASTVV